MTIDYNAVVPQLLAQLISAQPAPPTAPALIDINRRVSSLEEQLALLATGLRAQLDSLAEGLEGRIERAAERAQDSFDSQVRAAVSEVLNHASISINMVVNREEFRLTS